MDTPNLTWIKSWHLGLKPSEEESLSLNMIDIFEGFWEDQKLSKKSKTTIRRYSNSLHSIGGHIINQIFNSFQDDEYDLSNPTKEIILLFVNEDEGPWIYDNEEDQRDIDLVSKKLYKYLKR